MTPNPSWGIRGSEMPIAATDDPGDLQHGLGPGEHPGADVLVDVALHDGVAAQLDQLGGEAGHQAEGEQRPERVEDAVVSAARTSRISAAEMITSGRSRLRALPTTVPRALPVPAAPTTRPSTSVPPWPGIGCSRMRKAMKSVRKPVSSRAPTALQRAASTVVGSAATRDRRRLQRGWRARSSRRRQRDRAGVLDVLLADGRSRPGTAAGSRGWCRRRR